MQMRFDCDVEFKEQLASALTVDICSKRAEQEVCSDIVKEIAAMMTPRFADIEDLESEGVDWKDTDKALIRVAQLELREGKELAKGFYIRAAIAHFGEEKWWQLMASPMSSRPYSIFASLFVFVEPGVIPNEVVFALTIPPIGNPLRRDLLSAKPSITFSILDVALIHEHRFGHGMLDAIKEYMRGDSLWQELILCDVSGVIAAVSYCVERPEYKKVSKRLFVALLPDESALSDVHFWQTNCPRAVAALYSVWEIDAERHFRDWVSADVWEALDNSPLARVKWLERKQKRALTLATVSASP